MDSKENFERMNALLAATRLAEDDVELIKALSSSIASQVVQQNLGDDARVRIEEASRDSKRARRISKI